VAAKPDGIELIEVLALDHSKSSERPGDGTALGWGRLSFGQLQGTEHAPANVQSTGSVEMAPCS
jgi:hypothetical protein